ncbi:FAD-binding oxidoreductase [Actinoplanes sp. NEAU-A12]|uniref:FAD-binding oxidoreductase n=1 Tax=Actinoplanes sandaracinus TaxID=3045177 RepID=A0ABT6WLT8_9ACTN|nr:FAD-binding oxidoreductase [Actinoplanes sandaracinus]MDI6100689.1 FAD-binding oxidoreductase [Actinoplanes sandaracinus]
MSGSLLAELVEICGPGSARVARPDDQIAGLRAGFVAAPATTRSVAQLLHLATERGLSVRPRGSGSKFDWGTRPERLDLIIETGRLNGLWDHDGTTAVVAAGTTVRAAQAALAPHGKRLTIDPPSAGATIGGVLALNESGPLRHRFGPPAGQAVSVGFVGRDGRFVESAEWEGPAGEVITSAVFPLEEAPESRRWVVRPVTTPTQVGELVSRVSAPEFALSGVEVDLPASGEGAFALLLEGPADFVAAGAGRLAREMGPLAAIQTEAPAWWGRYPFTGSDVVLRIRVRSRDLHAVGYALRDAVGAAVALRGSAGAGVVHAVLPRGLSAARIGDIVVSLKQVLLARRGQVVVLTAPPGLAAQIEMARPGDLF